MPEEEHFYEASVDAKNNHGHQEEKDVQATEKGTHVLEDLLASEIAGDPIGEDKDAGQDVEHSKSYEGESVVLAFSARVVDVHDEAGGHSKDGKSHCTPQTLLSPLTVLVPEVVISHGIDEGENGSKEHLTNQTQSEEHPEGTLKFPGGWGRVV